MRMLTMWSCLLPHLAGWFLVLLRLDVFMTCWSWSKSQFVVGLYHLCAFVVPLEKRDKPSLTYISLKNSLRFAFPLEIWCLSQNERLLTVSKRKVACNVFKSRRLRCETLAPLICFCFYIAFLYFAINVLHLLPKSSTTVKRRWNGSSATLIPAFEGKKKRINILNSFKPLKCCWSV